MAGGAAHRLPMSYCRWSSLDFQCDLYIYESDSGFEVHVASHRRVFAEPLPGRLPMPGDPDYDLGPWIERHQQVMQLVDRAELVPIGLPHDGESLLCDGPGECADTVERLLALGYVAPGGLVAALRDEQAELDATEAARRV